MYLRGAINLEKYFCELSSTGIFDVCCIMQSKIKPHHQAMRFLIKNVLSDSDEQLNIKTS